MQLGAWRLDTSLGRLVRGSDELRLEPKLALLLAALGGQPGDPVTRDDLMDRIWGHGHVTDDALNRLVGRLRKQLRNTDMSIETLPRVGYRLAFKPIASDMSALPERPNRWSLTLRMAIAGAFVAALAGLPALVDKSGEENKSAHASHDTVPLTTLPGMEATPAYSPDGALYFSHRDASGFWRIFRRESDTAEPTRVTEATANDLRPVWRPDGRGWAFLRREDGKCQVLVWMIGQPAPASVADCGFGNDDSLDWSPEGNELLFSPPGDGPYALALLDVTSRRRQDLTRPPATAVGDAAADFSPDGERIAFVRWADIGVADVFVKRVSGGASRRVTSDGTKIHGLTWIDSHRLVFASDRGGGFGLWQLDLDSGELAALPVAAGEVANPAVRLDGARIAFESWNDQSNVVAIPFGTDDVEPVALVESTRWDWGARLSPAGDRLAFISDRSGAPELWIGDRLGNDPVRVTNFGGRYLRAVDWSPDGRWLVGEASGNNSFDIYLIDASGAHSPRALVASSFPERGARWSNDGQTVYFGRRQGTAWSLHRVDIQSGSEVMLHAGGGTVALDGPADRYVYFTDCLKPGFWRLSKTDASVEKLLAFPAPLDCQNWRLLERTAYLVRRADVHDASLHAYDLVAGSSSRLQPLPGFHHGGGLEVTAEGVLYAAVVVRESDLMARAIDEP